MDEYTEEEWLDVMDEAQELGRVLAGWHERLRRRVVPDVLREGLRRAASELHWAELHEDLEAMRFACSYGESVVSGVNSWMHEAA